MRRMFSSSTSEISAMVASSPDAAEASPQTAVYSSTDMGSPPEPEPPPQADAATAMSSTPSRVPLHHERPTCPDAQEVAVSRQGDENPRTSRSRSSPGCFFSRLRTLNVLLRPSPERSILAISAGLNNLGCEGVIWQVMCKV